MSGSPRTPRTAWTVLASVDTISGQLASGTIQAIATKPMTRWEAVVGKSLGFTGMLAVNLAMMFRGAQHPF